MKDKKSINHEITALNGECEKNAHLRAKWIYHDADMSWVLDIIVGNVNSNDNHSNVNRRFRRFVMAHSFWNMVWSSNGRNRSRSQLVLLTDYLIVPTENNDDIIYIYEMEACSSFENNDFSYPNEKSSTIWTMQDLYRWELEPTHLRRRLSINADINQINIGKFYHVHASIAYLSPILTSGNNIKEKDDTFALMWLVNNDGDEFHYATMVILRGNLVLQYWHAGLLPGQSILLNVSLCKRQKWRLPKPNNSDKAHGFPTDYYDVMIPKYVWFVTDPSQLSIYHPREKIKTITDGDIECYCDDAAQKNSKSDDKSANSTSIINHEFKKQKKTSSESTVQKDVLVTIEGRITQVHFSKLEKSERKTIEFIVLESDNDQNHKRQPNIERKLYLAYYPLPIHLIRCLQVGYRMRAFNVHIIAKNNRRSFVYGGCLRTKLEILEIIPKVMITSTSSCNNAFISSCSEFISKIRYTYADMEHMKQFKNGWSALYNDNNAENLESLNSELGLHWKLVWEAIYCVHHKAKGHRRDPYLEFLDSHTYNDRNGTTSGGCRIAHNEGRFNRWQVTSLHELITIGTDAIRTVLTPGEGKSSLIHPSTFNRGQLYSIHLSCEDVLFELLNKNMRQNKDGEYANLKNIWVGGHKENLTHKTKKTERNFVLQHKNLQLTVCPIIRYNNILANDQNIPRSIPTSDKLTLEEREPDYDKEFVMIQMNTLVITAFCIGKQCNFMEGKTTNNDRNAILLPSLNASLGRSCTLIFVQGWVFVVFLQLWYYDENVAIISNQKHGIHGRKGKHAKTNENGGKMQDQNIFSHGNQKNSFVTVRDTLSSSLHDNNERIIGRFVRQRFGFRKVLGNKDSSKLTSYITLTLSHINPEKAQNEIMFNLQSIELKVSISFLQKDKSTLKRFLEKTHLQEHHLAEKKKEENKGSSRNGIVLDEGSIELVCVFQKITENPSIVSILSGGFDETCSVRHCNHEKTIIPDIQMLINFPQDSCKVTNLGYKRFACSCDDIDTIITQTHHEYKTCDSEKNAKQCTSLPIQFTRKPPFHPIVGGDLHLPGTLDSRFVSRGNEEIRRINFFAPTLPEYVMDKEYGVPTCSLIDVQWDICRDYRRTNTTSPQYHAAPSLVRRISHSRMINLSFCRARVQCTRCFKFLSSSKTHQIDNSASPNSNKTNGTCFLDEASIGKANDENNALKRKTYWHLPLPQLSVNINGLCDSTEQECVDPFVSTSKSQRTTQHNMHKYKNESTYTKLICPSGCSIKYATVKWECSGTLDDGTCQAKLYAEREVALLLLGEELDIKAIEQGAWAFEEGIVFTKSSSLISTMNYSISKAHSKARQLLHQNKKGDCLTECFIMQQMSIVDRAKYLMCRYCLNYSKIIRNDLIFFCRCKSIDPKKVGQSYLQSQKTHISIARHHQDDSNMPMYESIRSYSLPPLRLILVDISLSYRQFNPKRRRSTTDQGWDYIRAMKQK